MNKGVLIKGNKDGLNIILNRGEFDGFEDLKQTFLDKLSRGKQFYVGSTVYITTRLNDFSKKEIDVIRNILLDEIKVKEIILQDEDDISIAKSSDDNSKIFSGVYDGKAKFINKTIRGGQVINYSGNIVIIGDINNGAEVYARGNIIVLGSIKGKVFAGVGGNNEAVIAAFCLQPEILKIGDIITMSPDSEKPLYPEIARVKDNAIIVEPYLNNKYI